MDFNDLNFFSEKNTAISKALLGLCHEHGWGTRTDKEKALSLYLLGFNEGELLAKFCLADYYMEHSDAWQDKAKAFSFYKELADEGDVLASYRLASCLQLGFGAVKDSKSALQFALKAAHAGYAPAQEMVGLMYLEDEAVKDLKAAHQWLEIACKAGMSSAAFRLAYLFETGEGTAKDFSRSRDLYKHAATLGSWAAHGRLAQAYRFGQLGLDVNYDDSEMHSKAESELLKNMANTSGADH